MSRLLNKRQITLIILAALTIIIGYFILPVSIPLILAFFTALFLNPFTGWLQFRLRIKRRLSVIIVFVIFLLIISTVGFFAVTKSVEQLVNLAEHSSSYVNNINDWVINLQKDIDKYAENMPDEFVQQVKSTLSSNFSRANLSDKINGYVNNAIKYIAALVAKIPDYLISILVYLIALFLFLLEMPKLKESLYDLMTEKTAEKVKFMTARLSYVVLGFLKAQFLVSIIIFIVSLIGLLIIIPGVALLMSLIIWIVDLIPIIGSIIILGPWSLYMFLAGDIVMGTKLAVLAVILLVIRRTVEPKVMGRHIGLSPLATLIAMYLGIQLLGILGFILGPLVLIAFNSAKEAGIIKWNFKL